MMFQTEFQYHLKARQAFVKFDLTGVPALQKDLPVQVSAAYTLFQMGVPADQALHAVGLRIGAVPEGDKPYGGAEPRLPTARGQGQGPHSDAEDDSWGMRTLAGVLEAKSNEGNGR